MTQRDLHVVVPTIDWTACAPLLAALLAQERRLARLTVVAQATGDDDAVAAAAEQAGVAYSCIRSPELLGTAGARLRGSQEGGERYVGFVNDDVCFAQGTLSALVDTCESERFAGAAARVVENDEPGAVERLAKRVLFRGVFADPQSRLYRQPAVSPSPLLPTGAVVYERAEFDRCSAVWAEYDQVSAWGEDAELSFCISRRRLLGIDGRVVVRNTRSRQGRAAGRTGLAGARLERYRRFADRHAESRRDRLHYLLVLVALTTAAIRDGGVRAAVPALGETIRTIRAVAVPAAPSAGDLDPPARDVDLVVRSLGRPNAARVVREALRRERRVRRAVVVWQSPEPPPMELCDEAAAAGIELEFATSPAPLGLAGARLAGIARVSSDWVAFLDDDVTFERGSLDDLVALAERRRAGGAGGAVPNYDENTPVYRVLKRLLFRGIFRDPRSLGAVRSRPFRSPVLSGGVAVFRRDLVERCVPRLREISGYGWGEDFEVSFSVSRDAPLYIVPGVRVLNGERGLQQTRTPRQISVGRIERYQRFADAHAARRRDWLHYMLVLVAVAAAGARRASSRDAAALAGRELRRAARRALSAR